ncbi:MAG: hexokinase [Treponema sp.]|nr:hexokinase [Treponema sp.]
MFLTRDVDSFLLKHNFVHGANPESLINSILRDMSCGLNGQESYQDMIKTYMLPPESSPKNETVIVIDAGGTNFRSCLVSFGSDGKPSILDMQKTKMPGVEKELSKKEFFDAFAENLEHLKDKSSKIGFCFSYPMTITSDGDGILIGFCKEVKAPQVEGSAIGAELKKALREHGWKNELSVALMNDTTSALLAGASNIPQGKQYSSYIGFILGTGMNGAYIQKPGDFLPSDFKKQIVVCESGKFSGLPLSDADRIYDAKSAKPGKSLLEKMCSGAYLGPVALELLKLAADDGLFSKAFAQRIKSLESLSLIELDSFLHAPFDKTSLFVKMLEESSECSSDADHLFGILDAVVERSASYSAALLCALVIKSGEGKTPLKPVCILCNGTTFYKTYRIRDRIISILDRYLENRPENPRFYELVSRENDITIGTAIGGLMTL